MNNNNIIEELAFMDEKLDKILERQELIMKKLSIMNKDDYITDDEIEIVGETMEDWFKDVTGKLNNLSVISVREGE